MKRAMFILGLTLAVVAPALVMAKAPKSAGKGTKVTHEWSMNGTVIEACSCPMFCSAYLGSGQPASHYNAESRAEERFCRFNSAIRVNQGQYKGTSLDGAMFWVSGDRGGDFSKGEMDWAVITFDKSLSQAQRDGISAIVAKLYPANFKSLTTDEGDISWVAGPGEATAMINNGATAEVRLKKGGFGQSGRTPVINDLPYWGAVGNTGFMLMPNVVEAYRAGDKPFEFKDTSGFMLTFDIHDPPAASSAAKSGF